MKRFFVRRDGNIMGPYTVEELRTLYLKPFDLIRDSTEPGNWLMAIDCEELKDQLKEDLFIVRPGKMPAQKLAENNLSKNTNAKTVTKEKKDQFNEFKVSKKIIGHFTRKKYLLSLSAVFIGALISTLFIKKLVDELIKEAFIQPTSVVETALIPKEKVAGKTYQNALVREIGAPVKEVIFKSLNPVSLKAIRKQIHLKGSNYIVGYFGGIDGLKLTLTNSSAYLVNRVELEINFLQKNGKIIETNTYRIQHLEPYSTRVLSVPPSEQGVKVNYRIMNIYTTQPRSLTKII